MTAHRVSTIMGGAVETDFGDGIMHTDQVKAMSAEVITLVTRAGGEWSRPHAPPQRRPGRRLPQPGSSAQLPAFTRWR